MTNPVAINAYSVATGTAPNAGMAPFVANFAPSSSNVNGPNGPFKIGQLWVNSSTAASYILAALSSSNRVVTATWVITGGGSGALATLTGDTGGAVIPSAGNINILGGALDTFVGSGSTLTLTPKAGAFPTTPFVVGPSGQAGYQTIQAGINAANSAGGGVVLVQPGTYTENLTLFDKCHVMGLDFADAGGGAVIVGVHTPPTSGGFVFNNVFLQSATNIFNSASAGSTHLIIANSAITVTNGYTFNLPNWTGKLETYDVNDRGSTNDGYVNNAGGAEIAIFSAAVGAGSANPMIVSGPVSIFSCAVGSPIQCVTGSSVFLEFNVHLNTISFLNNSTGEIVGCELDAQVTMSSSAAWLISQCTINTASAPAIAGAGAGTLTLGDVTFVSNATIAGTLTLAWAATKTGALTVSGNIVKNLAGNKDVYTSVATNATAGANSAGTVTLAGGTATVTTTAVTASSLIRIYRQSIGATGAAAMGLLSRGTITPGTSFVINSVSTTDATALVATDVSVVFWEIVN